MNNFLPVIIFLIALIIGWRSPRWGVRLALLSIPAYLIKFTIGSIPTQLNELIILGVAVGWLTKSPKLHFQKLFETLRPIWWQLALLGVGLLIGILVSTDLRLSLGIVKGWFITPILLYVLVVSIMTKYYLDEIIPILMLSTLPISIYAIIQFITGHFLTIDGRASAWFVSANYLTLYLVPILLLSTNVIFYPSYKRQWPFFLSVASLGLIAVYLSYSYGGWLGLAAGILVIGLWRFKTKWQFWLGSVITALVVGLTQFTTERISRMLNLAVQSSASVRLQIWATDWLMIKEHWLTGIGLGQYPARYPNEVTRLFNPPLEVGMLHAHNLCAQFMINLGLIGLIGFISLIVTFFRWVSKSSFWWSLPLTAAMVSILVHGLVDTPYWKSDLSVLFWVILALAYHRFQLATTHD